MNTPAQQPTPRVDRTKNDRSSSDRYLPLLFTASILLHEFLLLWFMGSPSSLSRASAEKGDIPISFVEVDPQQQVDRPQTASDRIGLGNSEAGEVDRLSSLNRLPQGDSPTDPSNSTTESSDLFQDGLSPQSDREPFEDTAEYARSQIFPQQETNPFPEDRADRSESAKPQAPRSLVSTEGTESIPSGSSSGEAEELFSPSSLAATPPQSSGSSILGGKGQVRSDAENLLASSGRSSQNDRSDSGNGADTRKDVDLAPYLANLKRQIERQWFPPAGHESSKVVLTFSISRSGTISNLAILSGSGRNHVDQAAIDAVQRAANSFGALPPGYSRDTLDIEFTFSITVEQPYVLY